MRRSGQVVLNSLLALTLIGIGIIIWILLFKQSAVPEFTVRDGKDAVVDYQKVNDYVDERISRAVNGLPPPAAGKDAEPVNYGLINAYIDSKIAALPAPKDGTNGTNGTNGLNGRSCTVTQLEDGAVITCEDGTSAIVKNGANAYIELRCNENRNRWEIRYSPSENFSVLNNRSTPCKATVLP